MSEVPRTDHVTGFFFLLGSLLDIYRIWRIVIRRVGNHSVSRVNRRRVIGPQLRYRNGVWAYP